MPLHPYAGDIDAATVWHLPKTDVHVHAETAGRVLHVTNRRRDNPQYTHQAVAERLMRETPPGLPRLLELARLLREETQACRGATDYRELSEQPDFVEACFEALMEEEAANGSVLAEVRLGSPWVFFPEFIPCFRSAERRVQARYPSFHAEPIIAWTLDQPDMMQTVVRYTCLRAPEGIAGIDLYPEYRRYDYAEIYRMAERAAEAGLGITCHDGEFEPDTLSLALDIPGLTRLGHATQAYRVPGLLDEIARRGIVVEVSLTSNVLTGAVDSYETHPLRRFLDAGVRVTLCADDPVMFATDIGREYAIAAMLGFSEAELLGFARTGVEASFTAPEHRQALQSLLDSASPDARTHARSS
jgi:adenosine deaminase